MSPRSNKVTETTQLLNLYENAITKQQTLLDKTVKGKFKSTQLSDGVLKALVLGDLNMLKENKEKLLQEIRRSQPDGDSQYTFTKKIISEPSHVEDL